MVNFDLKKISEGAIGPALEKAMRYRLLNDPGQAESICRDILGADPNHEEARVVQVLAMTDQFPKDRAPSVKDVRDQLTHLKDEYKRTYYTGIVCERKARAVLHRDAPGAGFIAYDWFRQAMEWFEKAEKVKPTGNDEAILHWNACARTIMDFKLEEGPQDDFETFLE